jgi:nitrogen fixation protein FixH
MAVTQMKQKELTGRHVLIMLVTFFGILIAVNVYFTVMAVSSFRGEDVKGSYRQGLEYNQTIAAREQQKALGWTVKANLLSDIQSDKTLIVQFKDSNDISINGLTIEGALRHPTDLQQDKAVTFEPKNDGRYEIDLSGLNGQWQLRATATNGEDTFLFEHTIITEITE